MEKRRVTITIGGQPYSFYSDDPEEYIKTLEQRANAAMKQTERFGASAYAGAVFSVISLTDQLLRTEQAVITRETERPEEPPKTEEAEKPVKKEPNRKKAAGGTKGQVSVWDLLGESAEEGTGPADGNPPAGEI